MKELGNNPHDQALQAMLSQALAPTAADAAPAGLAERIVAATAPRLGRRSVIGRIEVAAAWLAAAACVVVAVGLGEYWFSDQPASTTVWSSADESRIAQLAEASGPGDGVVEVELRSLALAVEDIRSGSRESWDVDEPGEYWAQSEEALGVF